MKIEIVKEEELCEVEKVIERSIRYSFKDYYPEGYIEDCANKLKGDKLKNRASWTHFYVVKIDNKIVGCGAIGPYWDSKEESCLFNIFVDPDYQKQGIGKKIIETLEKDEYFLRAKRIEIPAGIVAIPFYKKMGYTHKNGILIYEDGHFAMEKFNNK